MIRACSLLTARALAAASLIWLSPAPMPASAQNAEGSVDLGGHLSFLRLSEFDRSHTGIGGHLTWHLAPAAGVDGQITFYPGGGGRGAGRPQPRLLGLAGLRSGVRRDAVEWFGRARAGFLRFAEQSPVVCIAVFPPPLACRLADGYTGFAADIGGGIAVLFDENSRARFRMDMGDLIVRYGVEAQRQGRGATGGFSSHNLYLAAGVDWRIGWR